MADPRQVVITRPADGVNERLKVQVLVEDRVEVPSAGTGNDVSIADGQIDRRHACDACMGMLSGAFQFFHH